MTINQKRMLMSTSVLTLGAAVASGEDTMTANIPFAFQIAGLELPVGKYAVTPLTRGSVVELRNIETPHSGGLVAVRNTGDSREGTPRLVFNCYGGHCGLAKVSFGGGRGWECSNPPHVNDAQKEHLATVYVHRSKIQ